MSKDTYNSALADMKRKTEKNRSMDKVKERLRKEFRKRVSEVRFQCLKKRRNLVEKIFMEELQKIKENIQQSNEISDLLLNPNEMAEAFNEIEAEIRILHSEALFDEYLRQEEEETNAIVNNLFMCKICDNVSPNNAEVCANCAVSFFTT